LLDRLAQDHVTDILCPATKDEKRVGVLTEIVPIGGCATSKNEDPVPVGEKKNETNSEDTLGIASFHEKYQ